MLKLIGKLNCYVCFILRICNTLHNNDLHMSFYTILNMIRHRTYNIHQSRNSDKCHCKIHYIQNLLTLLLNLMEHLPKQ